MSTLKAYELFPHRGGFSAKTVHYQGTKFTVAATSVRQAYALAYQRAWIHAHDRQPVGIVSICRVGTGTTLWCGCSGHSVTGGQVRHGAGITAIRKAIEGHHCPRRVVGLRQRLVAAATACTAQHEV
ncbi:hypothetical protein H8Z59_20335 [Mycolicibacterium fortuitum]|uniref:hypothetical protein n=1 Tax=Mycobacteriaceae TaxID=1762 RepID=UPI0007FE1413|nr:MULTISPECIES: hypothetical protein [Mycobacteriaceae]OBG87867.1 hypothetical protein A5699_18525 [Mycobacterium sp. E802]UBV19667.1 hypothetical protein H8Z59_20335 [Mycolicibacterium fortuitum]